MSYDSQVRAPRKFASKYKLEILAEIDAATEPGEVGRILRRENLYSSLITHWRRQREAGASEGLRNRKRGPAGHPDAAAARRWRGGNGRLAERLGSAQGPGSAEGNGVARLQE